MDRKFLFSHKNRKREKGGLLKNLATAMAGSKIGRYFEIENWPLFRLKRAGHAVSIFRFDFLKKISQKKNWLPASPTSIGIENFSFAYSNQNSGVAPTLNIYVEFNYDFFFISDDSLFSTFLFVRLECSRIVGRPIARKKSW